MQLLCMQFSQLSIQISQVYEETSFKYLSLYTQQVNLCQLNIQKKHRKGMDMSKFAWTSEPQIPENKTYYYSNSDCDVIMTGVV